MNPAPTDRDTESLAQALRRAARVLDTQRPSPALREALLQRLQQAPVAAQPLTPLTPPMHAARGAPRRWLRWTAWSGGAAVAAMLLLGSVVLVLAPPPLQSTAAAGVGGEFLPLVPREDWPEDTSPAWLVASELPQERLAALGLPYDPTRAADRVRAELLVHPSGLVLALRLID
jgi:hypothetical protein